MMGFRFSLNKLKYPKLVQYSLFHDLKHHLNLFRLGATVEPWEEEDGWLCPGLLKIQTYYYKLLGLLEGEKELNEHKTNPLM